MKTEFTRKEADTYLGVMKLDNDIVRLVDPTERCVLDENGQKTEAVCGNLWGRCERCENCTSLRALRSQDQCYKIELLRQHLYLVHSRFMKVENRSCVMEVVKDVTGSLLMDSDQRDEVGKLIRSCNQQIITDSLTGVYNRRFLDEHFLPSLKCCHEENTVVNLAFLDMDNFKAVNDRYGHAAGDLLLKDVAGFWKLHFNSRTKGKERLVIRFGGDEIIILACGISKEEFEDEIGRGYRQMRKICYYTEKIQFPFEFTFGIASTEELTASWAWEELLELADSRMYEEKMKRKSPRGDNHG